MKSSMVFKVGKEADKYWKLLIKDISQYRTGSRCYLYKKRNNYIYYHCKEGEQIITLYLDGDEINIKYYEIESKKRNCLCLYISSNINNSLLYSNEEYIENLYIRTSSLINFLVKIQNK